MTKTNHYKDNGILKNQCKHFERTLLKEKDFIGDLAKKCRQAYKNGKLDTKELSKQLVDPKAPQGNPSNPKHIRCNGFKDSPRIGGEKQICHCMFYYNNDLPKKCKKSKCDLLPWQNVGDIPVIEFEYPSKYEIPGIGGIDLLLKYKNKVYGAEVKPPNSNETLSRMVSEILTYYAVDRLIDFVPAIAVFKGGKQYNAIVEFDKNADEDWQEIKKHITVFVIDYDKKDGVNRFSITPFDKQG